MTNDWLVDPLVWWFHFSQMILSAAHISSGRWCFPPAGCILPETEARCSHMQRMERDLDPYTSPTIKLLVPKDQEIICSYLFSLLPSMNCPQKRRWLLCYSAWASYDGRSWTTPQSGSLRDCRNALAMIYPYPARWMWREMIQSELSQDIERRSLSGPFNHFIQAEKWHSTIDEQLGQLLFSI